MTELNLRPVPASSASTPGQSRAKPIPSSSLLKPWVFHYEPSSDGLDLNLLVMFHGLGDTRDAFHGLGKQLNLPSTAVLSLQAPDPIPLLEHPAWSWYNTFTPLFEPLPNPNPKTAIPKLGTLLETLTSEPLSWRLDQIHLFGWGQGGTQALELALDIGQAGLPSPQSTVTSSSKRLGSVVSICAPLISFPTSSLGIETPICFFTRLDPRSAAGQKALKAVQRAFKTVKVVRGSGPGDNEGMPRGKSEWEGIMRFWSEVLARDEGWKGSGDVYEIVR